MILFYLNSGSKIQPSNASQFVFALKVFFCNQAGISFNANPAVIGRVAEQDTDPGLEQLWCAFKEHFADRHAVEQMMKIRRLRRFLIFICVSCGLLFMQFYRNFIGRS